MSKRIYEAETELSQTQDRSDIYIPTDKDGDPHGSMIEIGNLVPHFYEIQIGTWNMRESAYKNISLSSEIIARIKAIYGFSIVDDDGYTFNSHLHDQYAQTFQKGESEGWALYYHGVPLSARVNTILNRIEIKHYSLNAGAYTALYEPTGYGSQVWTPANAQVLQKYSNVSINRGYVLVTLNPPA